MRGEGVWNVLTAIFPNIPKVCSETGMNENGGVYMDSCNKRVITALKCGNMQEFKS